MMRVFIIIFLLFLASCSNLEQSNRLESEKNLKRIANAIHNYYDIENGWPPASVHNSKGRPLHSWRVLITTYLQKSSFGDHYKLSEPWDSEHNLQYHKKYLDDYEESPTDITRISECYQSPFNNKLNSDYTTSYVMLVNDKLNLREVSTYEGKRNNWLGNYPVSNDLYIIEIHNSDIHWLEPIDISITELSEIVNNEDPKSMSSPYVNGVLTLKKNGAIELLDKSDVKQKLKELLVNYN